MNRLVNQDSRFCKRLGYSLSALPASDTRLFVAPHVTIETLGSQRALLNT